MVDAAGLKKLRANAGDNYTLVSFWATWCGSCVEEFSDLQDTFRMYDDRGFQLVTVSANTPDEKAGVLRFLQRKHATSHNLLFASDDTAALQAAFDPKWQSAVPYTVLLAPGGKVLYSTVGSVDILELRRKILAAMPSDYIGFNKYWHWELIVEESADQSPLSLRSLMRGPEDGILKQRRECRIVEQLRMMPHKDVNVSCLVVFVRPHDGMISHLRLGVG